MATKRKSLIKVSARKEPKKGAAAKVQGSLFERVVGILEQARAGVVRAVNSHMVLAYWLIGREIVQEIQGGKERAAYGKQVLGELSRRLTERYGDGFSVTSLQNLRKFYQVYAQRTVQIQHPPGVEFNTPEISRPVGVESVCAPSAAADLGIPHPVDDELIRGEATPIQDPMGAKLQAPAKSYPAGSKSLTGFSPQLSWSHYRALMRVENVEAREFYEREAIAGGWDKRTLERQIHSFY